MVVLKQTPAQSKLPRNNVQSTQSGMAIVHGNLNDQSEEIAADIVVIHGLTGHYLKTWMTDSQICWPQDLLPNMGSQLGVCRIMSFGYSAGRHGSKVDLDIEDAAWQLIHELQRVRATVKALIISNNILSLRHILWAVSGVAFLATPHRGSAMADTAERFLRCTNVSGTPLKFIKSLKLRSPELENIADEFRQIVNQRRLPIASFYELHSLISIPCLSTIVVTKDSATLHIPSEMLYSVERNHRTIAKFENESDQVFQKLVGAVAGFLKQGPVASNAHVFVPWDTSSHFKGRRDILQKLHETLFLTPENRAVEVDQHRRVAMIYGDGGLGKTEVALKFARENEYRYNYIFFAEATSVQTLRADIANIHEYLGLPTNAGGELQDIRQFLRQQESWLFILDNDNDFASLSYLKLPEVDHGHVLITSRSREYTTDPRITKAVVIRPLEARDAADLVFSRAGIPTTQRAELEGEVKSLVATLACVPAMVENTAAYMVSFQVGVQDCLALMGHRKTRRSVLRYHSSSARYKLSAEELFRIRLDSLQQRMPSSYTLLTTLVWLDRTKTTYEFFKRATSERVRWGADGNAEKRKPQSSFVPEEFIEMCNSPEFDVVMNNLKSSSLIAGDEVFDQATSDSIVLHPSLYEYLRDVTSQDDVVKAFLLALTLTINAYPTYEAGLENETQLRRQMTNQVHQFLRNLQEFKVDNDTLLRSLHNAWGPRSAEFREVMAETLLEAIRAFEQNDEVDIQLINLASALLQGSTSVSLRTRLWFKRLPLEYAKAGKLREGCARVDEFLRSLEPSRHTWTSRDNAEVGNLRLFVIHHRTDEPGLPTERERWLKRAELIDAWAPLDPHTPSTLETYVRGLGVRMRGKLAKDFGQLRDAYRELALYCERYAERGSREEGWALGDWAELVLELEHEGGPGFDEPETLVQGLVSSDAQQGGMGFFGEEIPSILVTAEGEEEEEEEEEGTQTRHSSRAYPCFRAAAALSRAVETRMAERGYLAAATTRGARENDTMWLELMHAAVLAHQGRHRPAAYRDAEQELRGLAARFARFEAGGGLWHFEQERCFAVRCGLAQVAHSQGRWEEARRRWGEAVEYGRFGVKKWEEQGGSCSYYVEVARYSLADAQCSGDDGMDPRQVIEPLGDAIGAVDGKRVQWMMGMGTYWLDYVRGRMAPRIKALGLEEGCEEATAD